MIKLRGCYWCEHRKRLKCLHKSPIVDLGKILRDSNVPITEDSLRTYTVKTVPNGRIGCHCSKFRYGIQRLKERVVFT